MLESTDHKLVPESEEEVVIIPGERCDTFEASQYCKWHELVRRGDVIDKPVLLLSHALSIEATENVILVVGNALTILIGANIATLRRAESAENDWTLGIEDVHLIDERTEVMLDDDVALVAWRADSHFPNLPAKLQMTS